MINKLFKCKCIHIIYIVIVTQCFNKCFVNTYIFYCNSWLIQVAIKHLLVVSLTHRPRYPHTPDHNHQITNYHHLYPLPSPHISLLTSFPRRLVSRLYAIHYLLPYLLESWSSNLPFLQEQDKDCYFPLCELYMTISVGSHLFESSFCLC